MAMASTKPWQIIPPTPILPKPKYSGYVTVHQTQIWYAEYGKGAPVILLHGGLTQSNYWGHLVSKLQKSYHVIVIDSRGHGRSFLGNKPLNYHLMAEDVLGVMDALQLKHSALVGWSDGANIGLDLAIHHPERLSKLFVLGGNANPDGTSELPQTSESEAFSQRIKKEYLALSPTPSNKAYEHLTQQVTKLWASEPQFTSDMLTSITVPVWVVAGEYDEVIKSDHTEYLANIIPHAKLSILPDAGYFAFLQQPEKFNSAVLNFLKIE